MVLYFDALGSFEDVRINSDRVMSRCKFRGGRDLPPGRFAQSLWQPSADSRVTKERSADMIQPMSTTYSSGFAIGSVPSLPNSDEHAFRSWQSRRDAARQQIRCLSRRELQVVQLVSIGLANKSIALELEISVKTIEKHRANASRKLGVGSTAEMVRLTVLADQEEMHLRLRGAENQVALMDPNDN